MTYAATGSAQNTPGNARAGHTGILKGPVSYQAVQFAPHKRYRRWQTYGMSHASLPSAIAAATSISLECN
jgi:hypothetical protein